MIPKASTRGFTNMVQSNVKPGWSQVGARPSTRTDNDNENDGKMWKSQLLLQEAQVLVFVGSTPVHDRADMDVIRYVV
jgi:hypothetical protein